MTTMQESDSGFGSEEDFQNQSDLACNCELCHARMYVSMKQGLEDDFFYYTNQPNMGDGFHLPPPPSTYNPYPQQGNSPALYSGQYQFSYVGEIQATPCLPYGKCGCFPDSSVLSEDGLNSGGTYVDASGRVSVRSLNHDQDSEMQSYVSSCPQVYASKDGVMHIRLSNYVALELSGSAYRLINYRNNSTIALSDSGEYGYVYHYNCRGLINMHHEKISIAFDKDRQILLRNEKPSFVKRDHDYYRLTTHYWSSCRPVSMENFERDRTPDILKKVGGYKGNDEAKLRDLVSSSVMHAEGGGLIIYLGDAKIEQKVNGDVQLNWFYEDRANCMIVSPLAGTFSLSTKNLEIITTPKTDIYISFSDFFVHVGSQQMTVSNGTITGKCGSETSVQSSALNLNYVPSEGQIGGFSGPQSLPSSHQFYPHHPLSSQVSKNSLKRHERTEARGDDKDNDFYEFDFKSDTDSIKG